MLSRAACLVALVCLATSCSDDGAANGDAASLGDGTSAATVGTDGGGTTGVSEGSGGQGQTSATGPGADTSADTSADTGTDTGPSPGDDGIGEWIDEPGACPDGAVQVDIHDAEEMASAARGESDTDATCFFVHDGVYEQTSGSPLLYFLRGGTAEQPLSWVGESRDGVIVRSRATFEHDGSSSSDHIVLSNMTFDISTQTSTDAYNTITVLGSDITLTHLTLTGDCQHGARGGHIEIPGRDDGSGSSDITVEACLIENFGRCGTDDGALDHGVYISAGTSLVLRNNVIRGNASRGIQVYTHYEDSSLSIDGLLIERNRILDNGHADYQDGMVINGNVGGGYDGPLTNVVIRNNIFYGNYYSGIRFVGNAVSSVEITQNTFVEDGKGSSSANRSEINVDEGTPDANVSRNIFVALEQLTNGCAGTLAIDDNVVFGGDASGACVTGVQMLDPELVDPAGGDFHAQAAAAAGYGAYGP